MIKKTQLAKAVSMALAGTVLSLGAVSNVSAQSMYNTYNAGNTPGNGGTDGWVWGFGAANNGTASTATSAQWSGTSGSNTSPFDYVGSPHLNWGAQLNSIGASQEISRADAVANHGGLQADIDTTRGGWVDTQPSPNTEGWRHHTDIGLFKSTVTQFVTLNLSSLTSPGANFGVTVFGGQATNTGSYSHHGSWNNLPAGFPPFAPKGSANPFQTTGLETVVGWDETVDNVNGFTFLAQADEVYSIYLGGSGGIKWNQGHDEYVLNITSSPVPVPAAAWLMGTGLLGLAGMRRNKKAVSV